MTGFAAFEDRASGGGGPIWTGNDNTSPASFEVPASTTQPAWVNLRVLIEMDPIFSPPDDIEIYASGQDEDLYRDCYVMCTRGGQNQIGYFEHPAGEVRNYTIEITGNVHQLHVSFYEPAGNWNQIRMASWGQAVLGLALIVVSLIRFERAGYDPRRKNREEQDPDG